MLYMGIGWLSTHMPPFHPDKLVNWDWFIIFSMSTVVSVNILRWRILEGGHFHIPYHDTRRIQHQGEGFIEFWIFTLQDCSLVLWLVALKHSVDIDHFYFFSNINWQNQILLGCSKNLSPNQVFNNLVIIIIIFLPNCW